MKMWVTLIQAGLVGVFGGKAARALLVKVRLESAACKGIPSVQARGRGEGFRKQPGGHWWRVWVFGGKAGSKEEEEGPKEGSSGGRDILRAPGWGLGDASEVSQGPGTGRQTGAGGQDVGASLQRGLEPGRGKTSDEFWENVAARSEDVGLGYWIRFGVDVEASGEMSNLAWMVLTSTEGTLEPPILRGVVELEGCREPFWG